MITLQSRDLISLWFDLANGWVSGQEVWIDELIGTNQIAYHCLLTAGWDHRPFESEGNNLRSLMRIPENPFDQIPIRISTNGNAMIESFLLGTTRIDKLRKKSGTTSYHVYHPSIEFPRKFFALLTGLDYLFRSWGVPHMTPVALHITALKFSEVTVPFLLPILGRRAFFDAKLSEIIEAGLDHLDYIVESQEFRRKKERAVWKLVKKRLGPNDL